MPNGKRIGEVEQRATSKVGAEAPAFAMIMVQRLFQRSMRGPTRIEATPSGRTAAKSRVV